MDPEVFVGQVVCWRPGAPRPKPPHVSRKRVVFGLAAESGKARKPLVSGKCVVCWPWYPSIQKIVWPKKHFGICLTNDNPDMNQVLVLEAAQVKEIVRAEKKAKKK